MATVLERFRSPPIEATPRFKVEHTIPIPPDTRGRPNIYPFPDMGIGDSFFVATNKVSHPVRRSAGLYGKRHDTRFTVRTVSGGLRIWRTA